MAETTVEVPVVNIYEQLLLPCRCTIEGCLCPRGDGSAEYVRNTPAICDQEATEEDGLCNRCRWHLKNGHRD